MPEPLKVEYQHFYREWSTITNGTRTLHKEPRVTVCYLRMPADVRRNNEPWTAIGVAICSSLDRPCKKTGRIIARQRAVHAAETDWFGLTIERHEAERILRSTDITPFPSYKALTAQGMTYRFSRKEPRHE